MTRITTRSCTADEFLHMRDWQDYELVDGQLVPYPCGAEASEVCGLLISALYAAWSAKQRPWVFSSGTAYCFPGRPHTVRRPWVSVTLRDRLRREDIPS